jgi:hypothetical protein
VAEVRAEGVPGGNPVASGNRAALTSLNEALEVWVAQGLAGALVRWFERALDPDGVPRRLVVAEWLEVFRGVAAACAARPQGWPIRIDALAEGWFRALLRFSRPDGSPAFGAGPAEGDVKGLFRGWADRLADPGLMTVVDWWFSPGSRRRHAPPPLPADARPDRPLAVLRANWARDGEYLAIDHRAAGRVSLVELVAHGRPWLGPEWTSADVSGVATRARPTLWVSQNSADVAEWSFRVGRARVTRTAVLLRGRRLGLLAEQWDGPGDPGGWQVSLAEGVETLPPAGNPGLALAARRVRVSPRILPVGVPRSDDPAARDYLRREGRDLVVNQPASGRCSWRPLLLSWEPRRDRHGPQWQRLMVTQDRRVCGHDEAFAVRVAWRRHESLVIYRSLARHAIRAFLGHQTDARFLIGLFNKDGDIEPLVKVDG